MAYVHAFLMYIGYVLVDGDYLNDYYTHLPESTYATVTLIGHILAYVTGS